MQHIEHMKASLARRAKEAGLTVQETDAQLQERAQVAEALAFAGGITDEHGLPAAYAVARELTERHLGGRAAKLVDLLLEAGLAATPDAAVGVCRSQVGQDLAAELKALKWTCKMHKGKPRWMPPRARAEIAAY